MIENLNQQIEALIFASDIPLNLEYLKQIIDNTHQTDCSTEDIIISIEQLKIKYKDQNYSFELTEISGGYAFLTKALYFDVVATMIKANSRKKLSQAALETLAIIAYKQPVSKSELESIRGVSCDYSIQKLLEKELIEIKGRSETPGKPLLYGTTIKFMDYFGMTSMSDLPKPKDFKEPEQEIGTLVNEE
jgi:segregation and condensation protein B